MNNTKKTIVIDHTGPGAAIILRASQVEPNTDQTDIQVAAGILARRIYGRRGAVGAIRQDGYSDTYEIYEAFIGERADRRTRNWRNEGISGRNYVFYIPR